MVLDLVDTVWSTMEDGEFYSPEDLANSLKQPTETVTRVLEFLKKYKFADQVTRREMIYRKTAATVGPGDTLRVLQTLLGDTNASDAGQAVSVSKINRRPEGVLDVRLGNRIIQSKDSNQFKP